MHAGQHDHSLALHSFVQAGDNLDVPVRLTIARCLEQLRKLKQLRVTYVLEINQLPHRGPGRCGLDQHHADAIRKALPLQVIRPVVDHDAAFTVEVQVILVVIELEVGQVEADHCPAPFAARLDAEQDRFDAALSAGQRRLEHIGIAVLEVLLELPLYFLINQPEPEYPLEQLVLPGGCDESLSRSGIEPGNDRLHAFDECTAAREFQLLRCLRICRHKADHEKCRECGGQHSATRTTERAPRASGGGSLVDRHQVRLTREKRRLPT